MISGCNCACYTAHRRSGSAGATLRGRGQGLVRRATRLVLDLPSSHVLGRTTQAMLLSYQALRRAALGTKIPREPLRQLQATVRLAWPWVLGCRSTLHLHLDLRCGLRLLVLVSDLTESVSDVGVQPPLTAIREGRIAATPLSICPSNTTNLGGGLVASVPATILCPLLDFMNSHRMTLFLVCQRKSAPSAIRVMA